MYWSLLLRPIPCISRHTPGRKNWKYRPQKHGSYFWNSAVMLYTSWDISISGLWAAILDIWLPLASQSMKNIFIEFHNLENISVAVGILQLCWDISISSLRTAILDFWLPLAPHNIANSFIEFLNQENMGVWVEPLELCSYLAYKRSY